MISSLLFKWSLVEGRAGENKDEEDNGGEGGQGTQGTDIQHRMTHENEGGLGLLFPIRASLVLKQELWGGFQCLDRSWKTPI